MASSSIKDYYQLAKPGIVYGNLLPAVAGFFLASKQHIDWAQLPWLILGFATFIGSACVFNNYLDRKIDAQMERTKNRALVSGKISPTNALRYATALFSVGLITLIITTNWITVLLAMIGFVDYVFAYGYFKRRSVYGTLVGTVAGAMPPVIGYTAVTGHVDNAAIIMYLTMTFWQMSHFFAIAIFRLKDYKAAKIPVLPVVKGVFRTKVQIMLYMCGFTLGALALTVFGYTGLIYALIIGVLCAVWLYKAIGGLNTENDAKWARDIFGFSLTIMLVYCLTISVSAWLPF